MNLSIFVQYVVPVIVVAAVGGFFGFLIAIAARYFQVEVDERIERVNEMLPGYNCGACGQPGCLSFAEAIVHHHEDPKKCKPGKEEMVMQIKEYLKETSKS